MTASSVVTKWMVALVIPCLILATAPPTSAQDNTDSEVGTGTWLTTLTTTTGPTTLIGGGIALTIILVTNNDDDDDSSSKKEYIRRHAVALQQDVTIGGGESVRDLATVFQVDKSNFDAFARLVHENRDELVPLTDVSKLDDERADRFFRTIARGMQKRAKLRDDFQEITFAVAVGS